VLTVLRRRLRATRGEDGISLVELLVAMGLSTIIGAMTLALFLNVNGSSQRTVDRSIDAAQARSVLLSWTSYLQVADGPRYGDPSHRFEWITPTDMFFHADLGNRGGDPDTVDAPTGVWLRLTGGRLIEEQFAAGATDPSVCRILAGNVTAPALFTAADLTFAPMTGQDLGRPMATGGPGCTDLPGPVSQDDLNAVATLQKVGRIVLAFSITDTRGTSTLPFTSTADVPPLLGGTS
jgi:hypothetical protein